jgi:hypothetical protein
MTRDQAKEALQRALDTDERGWAVATALVDELREPMYVTRGKVDDREAVFLIHRDGIDRLELENEPGQNVVPVRRVLLPPLHGARIEERWIGRWERGWQETAHFLESLSIGHAALEGDLTIRPAGETSRQQLEDVLPVLRAWARRGAAPE